MKNINSELRRITMRNLKVLLLVLIHSVFADIRNCPKSVPRSPYVSTYQSSCLQIVTSLQTWTHARKDCQSRGGDLVVITSQAKQNFVMSQLASHSPKKTWIGNTDQAHEGKWFWVSGEQVNGHYGNWKRGQGPTHSGFLFSSATFEDCGLLDYGDAGRWNDYICDSFFYRHQYICEYAQITTTTLPSTTHRTFVPTTKRRMASTAITAAPTTTRRKIMTTTTTTSAPTTTRKRMTTTSTSNPTTTIRKSITTTTSAPTTSKQKTKITIAPTTKKRMTTTTTTAAPTTRNKMTTTTTTIAPTTDRHKIKTTTTMAPTTKLRTKTASSASTKIRNMSTTTRQLKTSSSSKRKTTPNQVASTQLIRISTPVKSQTTTTVVPKLTRQSTQINNSSGSALYGTNSKRHGSKSSVHGMKGYVIGILVGGAVVLCGVAVIIFFLVRRRRLAPTDAKKSIDNPLYVDEHTPPTFDQTKTE